MERKLKRVLFEEGAKDAIGKQVFVQHEGIVEWSDSRLHIKVPKELESKKIYYIRVANRGVMSYKGGGQDDESKFTMK